MMHKQLLQSFTESMLSSDLNEMSETLSDETVSGAVTVTDKRLFNMAEQLSKRYQFLLSTSQVIEVHKY